MHVHFTFVFPRPNKTKDIDATTYKSVKEIPSVRIPNSKLETWQEGNITLSIVDKNFNRNRSEIIIGSYVKSYPVKTEGTV